MSSPIAIKPPPVNKMPQQTPPQKPSRPPMLWMVILSGILCALLLAIGLRFHRHVNIDFTKPPTQILTWQAHPGQKVLLVMGVDAPNIDRRQREEDSFDGTRTDTMMLVRVDSDNERAAVVSIPRDSKVYISGNRGIDKINAAHALGGADLAVQTVQDTFGIPVDNFIVINFRGVRELVDALGGIDLYVEKPMHYTDRTAKLFIDFQPGMQHLDGGKAEEFLRFRHDELGDIGRIRRQQQFVSAVAKKLRDPLAALRIPQLVGVAQKYIETDLSPQELITLAFFAKDVNMNKIRTATLPGHPGGVRVSYWNIDTEPAQIVLDRLILNNLEPLYDRYVSSGNEPFKVGLLYDASLADQIPAIAAQLEKKNFMVVCRSVRHRVGTQIIEHTSRVTDDRTDAVRTATAGLQNARLIFAPVGTTFESNTCSAGEDYTLILGPDAT